MNIATRLFLNECKKRGIETKSVSKNKIFKLSHKKHYEYLYAQFFSITTATARLICSRKEMTKDFLSSAGIYVAEGGSFNPTQLDEALKLAENRYPVVLKPSPGGHGDGVFANIINPKALKLAWVKLTQHGSSNFILEKRFEGKEYRILSTRDKVLGVIHRIPAHVTGDGETTISKLINEKNSDPRRSDNTGDPVVKIFIDDIVIDNLKKQGLKLNSMPKAGKRVYLRENSNVSTGGESIDYTEKIHPSITKLAIKIIRSIPGLPYGGIDIMTKDITKEQKDGDYIVIEVNSSPGIDLHHFPYKGKKRNVAGQIVNLVFPETTPLP